MPADPTPAPWDGRPENPDVDGWHWVQEGTWPALCLRWLSANQDWEGRVVGHGLWRYIGPALSPSEHHQRTLAAYAAGWEAMQDAGAQRLAHLRADRTVGDPCQMIRALSPPADAMAALAEVVRRAKEEEREACASFASDWLMMHTGIPVEITVEVAAAIRARSTEPGA